MPIAPEKNLRRRTISKPNGIKARSLSDADKAQLLEQVKRDWLAGVPMADVVKKHGVSSASIYRWWRQSDSINSGRLSDHCLFPIDISDTLDTIADHDLVPRENLIEAIIKIITWVRWPNEPEYHTLGIIRCLSAYVRQTNPARNLGDLSETWKVIIFPYLSIELIDSAFSPWAPFVPDYGIVTNSTSRNDDLDFYAKITHYLISEPFMRRGRTVRPTLKTAALLLQSNAFSRRWVMSDRTFQSRWRSRGISFPFLYVERFHSALDWNINPQDSNFAESIDALLQSKEDLINYFGMVAWTQNRFLRQLDQRAQRGLHFAKFSKAIPPIPVQIPPLPDALQLAVQRL